MRKHMSKKPFSWALGPPENFERKKSSQVRYSALHLSSVQACTWSARNTLSPYHRLKCLANRNHLSPPRDLSIGRLSNAERFATWKRDFTRKLHSFLTRSNCHYSCEGRICVAKRLHKRWISPKPLCETSWLVRGKK